MKPISRRPLGALLDTAPAKNALGSKIAADMVLFTQISVNPAKDDYTDNSGHGPVFCYNAAAYAYSLARRFGCAALQTSGDLNNLVDAAEDSTRQDRYFLGADLSTGVEHSEACAEVGGGPVLSAHLLGMCRRVVRHRRLPPQNRRLTRPSAGPTTRPRVIHPPSRLSFCL